ncbi:MAG: abortive infection family protein [bacterium]|nr:abortive infection family protein [bacterium]
MSQSNSGFLKAFEENILRCVAIMRNEEKGAGHGQGPKVNEIPGELAELGVHLSGVLIHYLIKKYISTLQCEPEKIEKNEDIPF